MILTMVKRDKRCVTLQVIFLISIFGIAEMCRFYILIIIFNLFFLVIMTNEDEMDDFNNQIDNLIFSLRTHAEFYSYPKLMEMLKTYKESHNKEEYLSKINLNVNPTLEESLGFGPSLSTLEMIFNALSVLDVDFLVSVANLVTTQKRAILFEGMIYMGLSTGEEYESEA